MKRILLFILTSCTYIFGYSQECTTMWPYVYPDFKDATIYMVSGHKYNYKVNVHVLESTIHYLDGNVIKQTLNDDIFFVEAGEDRYMCFEGKMMKVVGSAENGFVATLILGDFDRLFESNAAYGTSSNVSAASKLSSLAIGGIQGHVNYTTVLDDKDSGRSVDLVYKYYIVTSGKVYPATKKGIKSKLDKEKTVEFKKFLKEYKIAWKDPRSLIILLDFLNT